MEQGAVEEAAQAGAQVGARENSAAEISKARNLEKLAYRQGAIKRSGDFV